jgi:hypothetical protein
MRALYDVDDGAFLRFVCLFFGLSVIGPVETTVITLADWWGRLTP